MCFSSRPATSCEGTPAQGRVVDEDGGGRRLKLGIAKREGERERESELQDKPDRSAESTSRGMMLVVGGRESWRRTEESASARSVEPEGPRVTSTPHDPLHILSPSLIFARTPVQLQPVNSPSLESPLTARLTSRGLLTRCAARSSFSTPERRPSSCCGAHPLTKSPLVARLGAS